MLVLSINLNVGNVGNAGFYGAKRSKHTLTYFWKVSQGANSFG